jgi:UDP-glucose 4-epimerase
VAIFAERLLKGEQPVINGTGQQTRDFICVDDVVEANIVALAGDGNGIYNVGTGGETSILSLYRMLADRIAPGLSALHAAAKLGEQQRIALDCGKISKAFGWRPRTSIEEGLAKTIEYYRNLQPGRSLVP